MSCTLPLACRPRSHNVVSDELPEKNPLHMSTDTTYDDAISETEKQNELYEAEVLSHE